MHRNRVNGKVYIGMTSMAPNKRWEHGHGYASCRLFNRAIKKYGWENFDHLILYDELTFEEACYVEAVLISKYESTNNHKGYNITSGGDSFKHSDETKQILRNLHLGKPMPDEVKQKISISNSGEKAYWYGRRRSTETCEKISKAKTGKSVPIETRKKISDSLKGDGCYWHGKHLSEEHRAKISEKNSGRVMSDDTKSRISKALLERGGKTIDQFSLDGQFIRSWRSIAQAAKSVNGDYSYLAKCCKNNKPVYGYIWRYSESEKET